MSKYFKFYDTTKNPDLIFIRECLAKLGELRITDGELEAFWCMFSEESYSASFVMPEEPIVEEFAEWLSKYGQKETI